MIKFVVENERFFKKNLLFFCDKSPLEDVKVRDFKSKIALGVQYTPCDHEGLSYKVIWLPKKRNRTLLMEFWKARTSRDEVQSTILYTLWVPNERRNNNSYKKLCTKIFGRLWLPVCTGVYQKWWSLLSGVNLHLIFFLHYILIA